MNLIESMQYQKEFEMSRVGTDGSLWEYNGNPDFAVSRTEMELEELREALKNGDTPKEKALEAIDVIVFMTSVLTHISEDYGIPPETISDWMREKLEKNKEKYKPEYFEGRSIEDGLQYSRDMWKPVPLGEWSEHQYIDQMEYISSGDNIV